MTEENLINEKALSFAVRIYKLSNYLKEKKESGEEIHSSEYKKHKKDILRIVVELTVERPSELPAQVLNDIRTFIESLSSDPFDVNTLINYGVSTEDVVERLRNLYL